MGLSLVLLSELDAVNAMLELVGETPVSSLPATGVTEAYIARTILHRTSREVQSDGLDFNTDRRYQMTRDVSNEIEIAANVLNVDAFYHNEKYVARYDTSDSTMKLYDQLNFTFTLTLDPLVDITWFYAWEGLPPHVRDLVYVVAGRKFQARFQSSETIHGLTAEDEVRARAEFLSHELRSKDESILTSPGAWRVVKRRV
jgi:hypothetical protein